MFQRSFRLDLADTDAEAIGGLFAIKPVRVKRISILLKFRVGFSQVDWNADVAVLFYAIRE